LNNGVAHSFHTRTVLDTGSISDQGWTTVETVLVRLNTSFTPSGRFPIYGEPVADLNGVETRIGYDAVVCVQRYDPWIVEAYNTSVGSPTVLRIVEEGYGSTLMLPNGGIRGPPLANTRNLNTTGKNRAFYVAHDNSVNQMVKDNGRDRFYVPSPTVSPAVPLHATSFLIWTYLTGHFFHRWGRTRGIHRTVPRPVRGYPCTSRRGQRSTIPCRVGAGSRTTVPRSDARIRHLQAVATDWSPGTRPGSGNHWRTFRADVTT